MSVAYMQDDTEFIANKLFPVIPVDHKSDDYYIYDKEAFLRAIAETREGAEESRGIGWKRATDSYNATQKSIHHDVPIDIAANTDNEFDAYQDAIAVVSRSMLLRQEVDLALKFFKAGVWTNETAVVAAPDKWDVYDTSDPYDQIISAKRIVQLASAVKPNTMVLGPEVLDALANHPDLKDRFKYTTSESITVPVLERVFGMRILVGEAVSAVNADGATTDLDYVYGKNAWLGYVAPRPSMLAPSAGYIFSWKIFGNKFGAKISKYPMRELNDSQRIEGDMAYDIKIVAPDAGYFFGAAVS